MLSLYLQHTILTPPVHCGRIVHITSIEHYAQLEYRKFHMQFIILLRICVYSNIQNTITRMMNFHNPALVRTVTFNFAESYQNVTMLRILMSDAQHKHVSYVVLT